LWDGNPRIAKHGQLGVFQTLRPRENYLRPYCAEKTLERWTWKPYRPPAGEIYFSAHEKAFGKLNERKIILGPSLKRGASPNKQWGAERWAKLALLLADCGDLVQCGEAEQYSLPGVKFISTSIRQAAALIASARIVICGEGALHHIAAAVGIPAVVIYGGYISPESTGYDGQFAFFRGGGLGCGMRIPCAHCAKAMASITSEEVAAAVRGML